MSEPRFSVGDEVVVFGVGISREVRRAVVERVTPAGYVQVSGGEGTLYSQAGYERVGGGYRRRRIEPLTDANRDLAELWELQQRWRKAVYQLDRVDCSQHPLAKLREWVPVLESILALVEG